MKKIRRLSVAKLRTVNKEVQKVKKVKVRAPKRHVRLGNWRDEYITSYDYTSRSLINVWCNLRPLPVEDTATDESSFLLQLRNSTSPQDGVNCSCCMNMIQRSIKQRMLGI